MADINGGRLLARCLANEGVRFLFGLPSPEIDPMPAAREGLAIKTDATSAARRGRYGGTKSPKVWAALAFTPSGPRKSNPR